jgi:hypothetical protein
LSSARTSNGFGLNPLPFCEIEAWARLSGVEPTPWEVSLLKRLDMVTLANHRSNTTDRDGEPEFEAAADDIAGVRAVLSDLKARAKAKFGKT